MQSNDQEQLNKENIVGNREEKLKIKNRLFADDLG
jgi:hypothetical protein